MLPEKGGRKSRCAGRGRGGAGKAKDWLESLARAVHLRVVLRATSEAPWKTTPFRAELGIGTEERSQKRGPQLKRMAKREVPPLALRLCRICDEPGELTNLPSS